MGISIPVMHLHGHFARYGVNLRPSALIALTAVFAQYVIPYRLGQLKLLPTQSVEPALLPRLNSLLVLPFVLAFWRAVKDRSSGITLSRSN